MTVGEGIDLLSQWGLLAVLSKLVDVSAVGLFGLAMAVIVPVTQLLELGLRKAQATDVGGEYWFSHYFSLRAVTSGMSLLLIMAIGWILGVGVYGWTVIFLMAIARIVEGQSDVFHGLFQLHSRMDYIARARMLRGPLQLALFSVGIYFTDDLRIGSLGLIVAAMAVLLFNDVRLANRLVNADAFAPDNAGPPATGAADGVIAFVWDQRRMVALTRQVLPLGLVAVLASLQMNIPRYVVEHVEGLEALGYFTAISVLYSAAARMTSAVAHSATANMAHGFAAGDRRAVIQLHAKLGAIGFVLGAAGILVAMVIGPEVLTILYTRDYAGYADLLVLIMVAAAIRHLGSMWQLGVVAARRFRLHLWQHLGNTIVSVAASFLLIGPYGLYGAAYAIIVVAVANLVIVLAINVVLLRNLPHRS